MDVASTIGKPASKSAPELFLSASTCADRTARMLGAVAMLSVLHSTVNLKPADAADAVAIPSANELSAMSTDRKSLDPVAKEKSAAVVTTECE